MFPGSTRWTSEEIERLRELFPRRGAAAVSAELGRTIQAVWVKANLLGIRVRSPRWTARDDARLRLLWAMPSSLQEIARKLERSHRSVFRRAQRIGLPFGVPHGYEYLTVASKRSGYANETLVKILEWAGVRVYRTRAESLRRAHPRRYVDPFDVDEAVTRWNESESVRGAARRHGVGDGTMRRWLLRIGVQPPADLTARRTWRVRSVDADRAMAERERAR